MAQSDDRTLVEQVLAQRPAAFEQLIKRYQGLCWHIIYRLVRHPEDARDLCQDCFVRVLRYLPGYRHECSLKSWIGRVAYSTAARHLQRQRIPMSELPDDDDGDAAPTSPSEDTDLAAQ